MREGHNARALTPLDIRTTDDNPTGMITTFFATEGDAIYFHTGGHLGLQPGPVTVYDADLTFLRDLNKRGFLCDRGVYPICSQPFRSLCEDRRTE